MRNWKQKLLMAVLCLVLVFALASCNNSDDRDETVPADIQVQDIPTVLVEDDAPTEDVTYTEYDEATDEEPTEAEEPTEVLPDEALATRADTFSGVFVFEDDEYDAVELAFFDDGTFNMTMSFEALELGLDIPGYVTLIGEYAVHEDLQEIWIHVDYDSIETLAMDLIDIIMDYMLADILYAEFGEDFVDLLDDEDFLDGFLMMMSAMMEHMWDELVDELFEEFDTLILAFEGDFDRLWYIGDDSTVFVRQ